MTHSAAKRPGRVDRRSLAGAAWERVAALGNGSLDLLVPPRCAGCSTPLEPRLPLLCATCRALLIPWLGDVCRRCAMPVRNAAGPVASCPHCPRPRCHFDAAFAWGIYEDELRAAVLRTKQAGEEPLTLALGDLLAERLATIGPPRPDVIVPVPMHWVRRWTRGANGAELLAERVGRRLGRPVRRVLYCRRRTRKQGTLSPAQRRRNMRGAYFVRPGSRLQGRQVLLVDDVLTTGATASEAARVLKRRGAATVHVAIVARGVGTA